MTWQQSSRLDKMVDILSEDYDRMNLSESAIHSEMQEIDEALQHAALTRNNPDYSQSQRDIVDQFIDDLLDTRLGLSDDA